MKNKKITEKKKYWYKFITNECVICGAGGTYKFRVYDKPKPKKWEDRYEYNQYVCSDHYLCGF